MTKLEVLKKIDDNIVNVKSNLKYWKNKAYLVQIKELEDELDFWLSLQLLLQVGLKKGIK